MDKDRKNKLKRPSSRSYQIAEYGQLCRHLLSMLFPYAAFMLLFLPTSLLSGQENGCNDEIHVELHPSNEGRGRDLEAREFIWEHWLEKKCGKVLLTAWSREGERTDSKYEIKASGRGAMILKVDITRYRNAVSVADGRSLSTSVEVPTTMRDLISYAAVNMERVLPKAPYSVTTAKVIRGDSHLSPSKYRLRFKDKEGIVIGDF